MALVGDVLVRAREIFPDRASYLATPSAFGVTTSGSGGNFGSPVTLYYYLSALNQWGETTPLGEGSTTFNSGTTNQITFTPTLPLGTISYRVYITATGTGQEQGFIPSSGTSALVINNLNNLIPGAVPQFNSAMNPDTDGGFVSASTIYRWLSDGLQAMGRIGNGIPSIYGLQAVTGQAMYRVPGRWIHFTNYWFDGWPMTAGKRGDVFLHSNMSSISGLMTVEEYADTTVIQMWPQPNRTGATGPLNASMLVTDTQLVMTGTPSFLSIGMLGIDSEIMSYSGLNVAGGNTTLPSVMRGLGGTLPAAHSSAATVTELNLRIAGFRQPVSYTVGQSALSLPLLPGWEVPLTDYLVAQYRKVEQSAQEASGIEKEFADSISAMARQFRGKTNPIQVGSTTRESYPGSFGGGLLIP